jgi:hypothetical protein
VLGGTFGLLGTFFIGPRLGVFSSKLSLDQYGALAMKCDQKLALNNEFTSLITSKLDVFKNGYRPPTIKNIKFANTVAIS